jgi:hypothetical protein
MKDLCHGYMFSQHNGFEPIANVPTDLFDITEDIHITKARELHYLLDSFTSVEEAAIRQITLLISMLRLSQGNIGSKGNTSCVLTIKAGCDSSKLSSGMQIYDTSKISEC